MSNANDYLIDVRTEENWQDEAIARLEEHGFLALRGLFSSEFVAGVVAEIEDYASHPALGGAPGYSKVDYPKKLFNPFSLGGDVIELVLQESVISLIERHMQSECVLAETAVKIDEGVGYTYFPLHSDFAAGWQKSKDSEFVLSAEDLKLPIGIGGAIYLHDTTEGAFSYCAGTHNWMSPHGQDLRQYPKDIVHDIESRKVRADGKAGDIVLFDDRGFHGPDQPSRVRRSVILVDYYRVATFGHTQVSPMPIWSSDLGRLSQTQLRVAGVGANFMVPPNQHTGTRFRRSPTYGLARKLVDYGFLAQHFRQRLKVMLGRA